MKKSISSKPLIRQGWLRSLIFIVLLLILVTITVVICFPEQFYTKDPIPIRDLMKGNRLFIFTLILLVLITSQTFAFRRWVDHKSFISLGFEFNDRGKEALAGFTLAAFIVCSSSLTLMATGHLNWTDIIFDARGLFIAFGMVILMSFYEELIFRGYLLNNLMDSFPRWLALLISSVLFMCLHWNISGFFPMLNLLIMGLILGLNYIYTGNLWFSICFHIGWKWMEIPVLGFSADDSTATLLQADLKGDENITGGINGLEGSSVLLVISLLSLLMLYLFLQKKFSPQSQPAPGQI